MKKLIEAFQIFAKYSEDQYPITCEHDCMYVPCVSPDAVSLEDKVRLAECGFTVDDGMSYFIYWC